MPAYINSPFQPPQLVQKGVAAYLIGSYSQQTGKTKLGVLTTALTSNVATVTGTYLNGPLPVVGSLISISGSTSTTGTFNVSRAVIVSVSYAATTNIMTFTFALTHADIVSAADVGSIIVEPAEVGESVTSAGFTSAACIIQAPEGDSQFTVPFSYSSGATQTAATATLQVAINANDGEWTNTAFVVTKTGASTYTAGPVVQATLQRGYAYRVVVSAVTGTDKAVCKIGG